MRLNFKTDKGIGTRATLGAIVLSTDETLEPEFNRMMGLNGVALYHSRIPMVPEIRPDTLARMETDLPAAAQMFPKSLDFDVIGYGCTSASTVIGSKNVARAIQTVFPDAKVTDPLAAILAALQALNVRRLGFITAYLPEVSHKMRENLHSNGYETIAFGSFEEGNDRIVARISEASIKAAALQIAAENTCEAIVISCTNLRCLAIIPEIEKSTNLPVISSNQALAWHMLRLAGINDSNPQFGELFTRNLRC